LDEKTKHPYAFALRSGEPFAFGGVWDAWKDPATEDWLQSFSIITTDPNELTATVHDRMPVILKPSDYDRWLDRADAERPPVDLFRPYEAAEMTAHEVDPRVGNVRNDSGYNRETVIAEKLQALVQLRMLNTRMKYYFYLWLLTRQPELNKEVLGAAIKRTFANRGMEIDTAPYRAVTGLWR
jgi:hypothetical protein